MGCVWYNLFYYSFKVIIILSRVCGVLSQNLLCVYFSRKKKKNSILGFSHQNKKLYFCYIFWQLRSLSYSNTQHNFKEKIQLIQVTIFKRINYCNLMILQFFSKHIYISCLSRILSHLNHNFLGFLNKLLRHGKYMDMRQ